MSANGRSGSNICKDCADERRVLVDSSTKAAASFFRSTFAANSFGLRKTTRALTVVIALHRLSHSVPREADPRQ